MCARRISFAIVALYTLFAVVVAQTPPPSPQAPFFSNITLGKNVSDDQTSGEANYVVVGHIVDGQNFTSSGGGNWDPTLLGSGFDIVRFTPVEQNTTTSIFSAVNGGTSMNASSITFGAGLATNENKVNSAYRIEAGANVYVDLNTGATTFVITSSLKLDCQPTDLPDNHTKSAIKCTSSSDTY